MSTRTAQRSRVVGSDRSRYDFFLALLPVPLLVGLVGASMTAVPLSAGAGFGSIPSALLLAYGLFLDGPMAAVDGPTVDDA